MSFAFKTGKSIIVDNSSFFIGTTGFNTTTTPSNENKINASDADVGARFGISVSVGSGRIVVGSYQDDENGFRSGAAYIYDLDGNNEVKITASDVADYDEFGRSVAVGSGRIVVGANRDDSLRGSAYIFDLDGTNEIKITASDGAADDEFGYSVAVGCGRIVVGAWNDDDNGSNSGSAYIFDLDGNELAKITASDGAADDHFGHSVSVGSGRIVVGAYGDDDTASASGSAYIFDLDGNQLKKITASDAAIGNVFGYSVAVGSGRIVVGAYGDAIGSNSLQGSTYIYDLDGNNEVKITASDGAASDRFGEAVAVGCGRIVVGVHQDDDDGDSSGSAYIYDLDGNNEVKITASDGATNDIFGWSVAVACGRIVVGAFKDDGTGSYIADCGAAYIYNTPHQIHYLDQLDGR